MDRCPSGVIGFDKLCQGGFVRNSDNILVGGPGSGKTTFLLQFLWNGVTKFGENGLYCSFEPDIVETLNDAMAHGWDFSRLSGEGRIKFMRFSPQTSIDELKSELTKVISKFDIRRVCFDPVSILALNQSEVGKMRQIIFDLSSLMKRLRVTTLFADEFLESEWTQQVQGDLTKTDILRFLSDSVTILYDSGISGIGDRALRIVKMRRTKHERRAVGMEILNNGVKVLGIPEEEKIEENFELSPVEQPQSIEDNYKEQQNQIPVQTPRQFPVQQRVSNPNLPPGTISQRTRENFYNQQLKRYQTNPK